MDYNYGLIPFERIHSEDLRFKISTGAVSAALVESICQFGLINPPVLLACSDGYRIVSGFKRIEAWRRSIDQNNIEARLLDPATPPGRCIQVAIVDNSSQRALNLVEQAHAVALLSSEFTDDRHLVAAASEVGLSVNPGMATKLKKLAAMDPLLKSGVLEGTIALPVALQLHDMNDPAALWSLGNLLRDLDLSLNRQREILEWIVSICRRDRIAPAELLSTDNIVQGMKNRDLDRRQKGQLVRDYLKRLRYPNILRQEQRFADTVHRLKLANGTSLTAPAHFEGSSYSLKLEFRNPKELSEKLQEMEKIIKSEILQNYWNDMLA